MEIRGLTPFTLIDYPQHLACVIYCARCNMRCSYCQNPYLVLWPETQPRLDESQILRFLDRRRGMLNGVVVSGGEPTLQVDLPLFLQSIRDRGFAVKLDTNGSNPRLLRRLLEMELVDMLGIDYKAPARLYRQVAGRPIHGIAEKVQQVIRDAGEAGVPMDVRTTVHRELLSPADLRSIRAELDSLGVRTWWLQQFHPTDVLDPHLLDVETYSDGELQCIASELGGDTRVRGLLAAS